MSIVLPAFNEEPNIEQAMAEVTPAAERLFADHEVIVVDDGSADATAAIVRARRGRSRVRADQPRPQPRIRRGPADGVPGEPLEIVFFTDADLQFDMNELERFLPTSDTVDVVAGYRVNRQDPLTRRAMA